MNRGVLQSSVNPNWWNNMRASTQHQQPALSAAAATEAASSSPFLCPNNSPNIRFQHYSNSLPFSFPSNWYDNNNNNSQDQLPESWSQLLFGGLVGELEDQKGCMGQFQAKKLLEDWEEEILNNNAHHHHLDHVKKEHYVYGHGGGGGGCGVGSGGGGGAEDFQLPPNQSWSPMIPASSPQSCVTSFSSNMLDFSNNSPPDSRLRHPIPDRSSECNSNATGGAAKKARVQSSSNQTTFKVRKEKLGDRITALHQLVSPFGKTDTASVLLEAIGYIRFLQSQIEALSLPYLGSASSSTRQQQQHSVQVQGERNCMFPEDPGQLLNENCLKRKGVSEQDEEPKKDLRSRGLCLVPVSCTLQVGSDNGADYWAPAFGGGGGGVFR